MAQQVYLVGGAMQPDGRRACKIGIAANPGRRLAELQTGSSSALQLLVTGEGGAQLERELHARFATDRLHGEWFALSVAQQDELVDLLRRRTPLEPLAEPDDDYPDDDYYEFDWSNFDWSTVDVGPDDAPHNVMIGLDHSGEVYCPDCSEGGHGDLTPPGLVAWAVQHRREQHPDQRCRFYDLFDGTLIPPMQCRKCGESLRCASGVSRGEGDFVHAQPNQLCDGPHL